ncbi:L,D-transpeptidase [Ktedonosporobacter rubrisoli]|uniref:L,D-transpeptidase n=1 Tax=Ktedonosporobacter rubrisoli TaxID=2509675 RepID=A0A4P6JYR5_KTERU|nr:L,D-transpeptidase [Ktedonosporobacter rubrisoli]QBD80642.1 L,D-transpeptidase [Ktedonosporobacter rubrisoli]
MHSPHSGSARRLVARAACTTLLFGLMLLTSACGGDAHTQQQAHQQQAQLDQQLAQARKIGVPAPLLEPILQKEQQIESTHAPLPFDDRAVNGYYQDLASQYTQLQGQVQAAITGSTASAQLQARQKLQKLSLLLAQQDTQKYVQVFQFYRAQLKAAHYPKEYVALSSNMETTIKTIGLQHTLSARLQTLQHTLEQLQNTELDLSLLQVQYQNDQQLFKQALTLQDFQRLNGLIEAQYQQAAVGSLLAFPAVSQLRLKELTEQIAQLKSQGLDASSYEQRLRADQALIAAHPSFSHFLTFVSQIDEDIMSARIDVLSQQARTLLKQFHQEVESWGNAHLYHDSYDGQAYPLDAGYMQPGIGSDLDTMFSDATTLPRLQAVIAAENDALFNLHLLEADYADPTPYDQVHKTDLQMIDHYNLQKRKIVLVSLAEQAMRVYQDRQLVRAFHVTTGRVELPAVPGVWPVLNRLAPTVFRSSEPPGSPYWYPDTPINYAIMYHQGGYFIHDSWWRDDYGPGTQFPHADASGNQAFAGNGSHGCVNMQEDEAAWVYNNSDWNTLIVIY